VVLTAGLSANLQAVAQRGDSGLTPEAAARLAANPNALIDPQAQASLPPGVLGALRESLATAIHNVFWVGTVLAAMALLVSFFLPGRGDAAYRTPTQEACGAEAGERMVMAELATLDPDDEPVASRGD